MSNFSYLKGAAFSSNDAMKLYISFDSQCGGTYADLSESRSVVISSLPANAVYRMKLWRPTDISLYFCIVNRFN